MSNSPHRKIAVIGLGYVGLPLAAAFGKQREVVGYDINDSRIAELRAGHDSTLELGDEELAAATGLVGLSLRAARAEEPDAVTPPPITPHPPARPRSQLDIPPPVRPAHV